MKRGGFKYRWRPNKYGAKKTWKDNILFDSKLESTVYEQLKMLQLAGEIKDLELQKEFTLNVNGKQICIYIADFVFKVKDKTVIADAKGVITDVFRIKWKLIQALLPDNDYKIFKKGWVKL